MKKFIYMAVAAIAALSSCTSDDAIMNEGGQNETGVTTFTATMEGDNATRATYNSTARTAEWEASSDKINVGGAEYTALTTGATTTFTGTGATLGGDNKYHAYFPASLYSGGTLTLPAQQTYTADKFNMPMYAESANTELTFYNLCAVLAVKVTSADIAELKSIKVKSDKVLSGEFTVSESKAVLNDPSDNSRTVELVSSSVLSLDETGTTFYIAIPAQEYKYLNIYLSADGNTYKEAMATKKVSGLGTIARSRIYSIDYTKNAVQLWSTGPYFATENASSGMMQWQAGMNAWGDNWTIPSKEQMTYLFDPSNITFDLSNGYKFTGRESGYTSVSLFLPAPNGEFYWSGTPDGDTQAWCVDLVGRALLGRFELASDWRSEGLTYWCFVRLVLR